MAHVRVDIFALIKDHRLPDEIRARVLPGLFRMAVESAAQQAYYTKQSLAGRPRAESEQEWMSVKKTVARLALAVHGDPTADLHQVGQAASQDPGSTPTVTLSPGQTASATLGIVEAGNFPPDCNMTPVSGLRVTPPGQTDSLVIAHADTACANPTYATLHVGPLASA